VRGVPAYVNDAAKDFLRGTRYKAPILAIEAGKRTITQWCETLDRHRPDRRDELVAGVNITKLSGGCVSARALRGILEQLEGGPRTRPQLIQATGLRAEAITDALRALRNAGAIRVNGTPHDWRNPPTIQLTARGDS
jgi:threonine dehydrogenase-like Zn-dependent dehydrogenase